MYSTLLTEFVTRHAADYDCNSSPEVRLLPLITYLILFDSTWFYWLYQFVYQFLMIYSILNAYPMNFNKLSSI